MLLRSAKDFELSLAAATTVVHGDSVGHVGDGDVEEEPAAPRLHPRLFLGAAPAAADNDDDAIDQPPPLPPPLPSSSSDAGGVASRDGRLPRLHGPDSARSPSFLVVENLIAHPLPLISPDCDASPFLSVRPTCNGVHSLDLLGGIRDDVARKVGKGGSRVVWSVLETHFPPPRTGPGLTVAEIWKKRRRYRHLNSPSPPSFESPSPPSFVLKTLRWTREFEPPAYAKNGREAAALELASFSAGVTDIYGHCGVTTANADMGGGDLARFAKHYPAFREEAAPDDDEEDVGDDGTISGRNSNSTMPGGRRRRLVPAHAGKMLVVALRLARAMADLHRDGDGGGDVDGDGDGDDEGSARGGGVKGGGRPPALAVIHRDLDAGNVLLSSRKPPRIYVDDFNYGYILRRTPAARDQDGEEESGEGKGEGAEEMCSYQERYICGEDSRRVNNRAPEECLPSHPLTRSVDNYGLGSIYFYLLTSGRHRPYGLNDGASERPNPRHHPGWYRDLVLDETVRPVLPPEVESSDNGAVKAVREVMRELMSHDPKERPSAGEVVARLEEAVNQYVLNDNLLSYVISNVTQEG